MKSLVLIIGIYFFAFVLAQAETSDVRYLEGITLKKTELNEQYNLEGDVIYKEGYPDYKSIKVGPKKTTEELKKTELEIPED